jgi:hypothetical protein
MAEDFRTSLLREKFILRDPAGDLSDAPPVIALSNRIVLPLTSEHGEESETYVVRTQNMHSCARLAAAIAKEYFDRGAIMNRQSPFHWKGLWGDVIKGYEKDWNPDIWAAIYFKGRPIFEEGERHPFLDIIEQCDSFNQGKYDDSVKFAEQAFHEAGKAMKIDHDSNIALIISVKEDEAKGGVILRGAHKKTTFNYTAKRRAGGENIRIPTMLTVSAAFLEGVQLAFSVGMGNTKRIAGFIEKFSDEDRKNKRGAERLINLNTAIESFEKKYYVSYRLDRPNFAKMVREAEDLAQEILRPQVEARKAADKLQPNDNLE